MANVTLLQNFVQHNAIHAFKVYGEQSRTHIKFSIKDVLFNQAQIVALWRSLNRNHTKPVAKTFLGKIVSISFLP